MVFLVPSSHLTVLSLCFRLSAPLGLQGISVDKALGHKAALYLAFQQKKAKGKRAMKGLKNNGLNRAKGLKPRFQQEKKERSLQVSSAF